MGKDDQVSFPVQFKNVGLGKETARIGVGIAIGDLERDDVHNLFCNAQLSVKLKCDPNAKKDAEGQQTFTDTCLELDMVADALKYSVGPDGYSVSLSTTKSAIDVGTLGEFSSQPGRLFCTRVGDAKESDDGESDSSGDED
jgi:hypothetical protein